MQQDKGASSRGEDRAVVNGAGQAVSAVPASVPSATPRHIIEDIGQKFASDVTAAAFRNFRLVDDAKAAFVVGTFGAAAAFGLTAAAYVDAAGNGGDAGEMIDTLWSFIRPMALETAAQAIETAKPPRREAGSARKGESAVGIADAPDSSPEGSPHAN